MLFVAEIGLNHDGNFDIAHELIRQAKLAGADIAKFQFARQKVSPYQRSILQKQFELG